MEQEKAEKEIQKHFKRNDNATGQLQIKIRAQENKNYDYLKKIELLEREAK